MKRDCTHLDKLNYKLDGSLVAATFGNVVDIWIWMIYKCPESNIQMPIILTLWEILTRHLPVIYKYSLNLLNLSGLVMPFFSKLFNEFIFFNYKRTNNDSWNKKCINNKFNSN